MHYLSECLEVLVIYRICSDWKPILQSLGRDYFKELSIWLSKEYLENRVYPPKKDILNVFRYTSFKSVKVVILGQDPYYSSDYANGLAFSVNPGIKIPRGLRNIYKELNSDLGIPVPNHGCLLSWSKQGVFLLNTALTVRSMEPKSHIGHWDSLVNVVLKSISNKQNPVVFILWGRNAWDKEYLINTNNNLVIKSMHPSPHTAYKGFFGSKPFSRTNEFLVSSGQSPVDWRL